MTSITPNIIRSSRKTISIQINENGVVTVRAPHRAGDREVERFLNQKQSWIKKTIEKVKNKSPKIKLLGDNHIYIQGKKFPISAKPDIKKAGFSIEGFIVSIEHNSLDQMYNYIFEKFFPHLEKKVMYFAHKMNVQEKINKIRLSKATTNWGSCNSKGIISLNWKLACLPVGLQDYIIVHELSHLDHMNHSPAFWQRVEQFFPNYKLAKKKLKIFSLT